MDATIMYPKTCRKSIRILTDNIGVSVETAYAMMLMTAALMDLQPGDDRVTELILKDCGIEMDIA